MGHVVKGQNPNYNKMNLLYKKTQLQLGIVIVVTKVKGWDWFQSQIKFPYFLSRYETPLMCTMPNISCNYTCHKVISPTNLVVVIVTIVFQLHPNKM